MNKRFSSLLGFLLVTLISLVIIPRVLAFSLDTSYGTNGIVTTPVSVSNAIGIKLALQPDGKAVIGGYTVIGDAIDWRIARYNTNGELDASFGDNGVVTHDFGFGSGVDGGVALQSTGKIIASGGQTPAGVLIGRFNTNGTVDTTFGINGFTSVPIDNASHVILFEEKVQPDDKVLVVGYANYNSDSHSILLLTRFTPDGALDSTFGNGGVVLLDEPGAQYHQTYSMNLQSDGKILVFGSLGTSSDPFILYRFNQDGTKDTAFGSNGYVLDHIGFFDFPRQVTAQSDGKILVSGEVNNDGNLSHKDTALIRYNPDGTRDASFANNGLFENSFGSSDNFAYSFQIQPDGKIIIGGGDFDGSKHNPAIRRLNSDGSIDTTFGSNGSIITDTGRDSDISTILFQGDGKILGNAGFDGTPWMLLRYFDDTIVSPTPTPTLTPTPTMTLTPTPTPSVPHTKDDCKDNNWKIYTDPAFKNQGQCIKYINHS